MQRKHYRILDLDPYLQPHEADILLRMRRLEETQKRLLPRGGTLSDFANGHLYYGFHKQSRGWIYREWAPNARHVALMGDFNGWDRERHPLSEIAEGVWEITLKEGELRHGDKVRVLIFTKQGECLERIPLYCRRVVQNQATKQFDGQVWAQAYTWSDQGFSVPKHAPLFIYESHVGMCSEKECVASFQDYIDIVLPRVKALGYNAIQLMAVMEHPYYGSFGYQVTNFFAVSSRFGTPEDFKKLVDTAHGMGIMVLLDLVHSHAATNELEGPARFDGTAYQFFHEGKKGRHPAWDTMLFNYGKPEVLHFLLSNLKFWLEEYHLDGFRFDGVTSMLYHDHGLGTGFDHYDKYFSANTDLDSVTYLQLASCLCKEVNPKCVLVAEDMSGMPGMALPVRDGGIGFDYRLGMGIPDFWIRLIRDRRDEQWPMGALWHELTQRRPEEKVIGYCESHDQALVGDKTLIFWLADKEMYWHMDVASQNPVIDRAMALHKMIRLVTCALGGEGYLNFMGNEFGHPEWIDFPREGNGWSYKYATRKWRLSDDPALRYAHLQAFDKAMIALMKTLAAEPAELIQLSEEGKTLVFKKADYLFALNFHPAKDITLTLPATRKAEYLPVLRSDAPEFGGCYTEKSALRTVDEKEGALLYLPTRSRTAAVYRMTKDC